MSLSPKELIYLFILIAYFSLSFHEYMDSQYWKALNIFCAGIITLSVWRL